MFPRILAIAFVTLCGTFPASAADYTPIFNGKDFSGWHAYARPSTDDPQPDTWKTWKAENGIVKCTGKPNGFLATETEYENGVLQTEHEKRRARTEHEIGVLKRSTRNGVLIRSTKNGVLKRSTTLILHADSPHGHCM